MEEWSATGFTINTLEHFYHVGPTESLRNSMTEALISNFAGKVEVTKRKNVSQPGLFDSLENGKFGPASSGEP